MKNKRTAIYRGIKEDDKLPVLVMLLKPEHPTHEELYPFDMTMKLHKS